MKKILVFILGLLPFGLFAQSPDLPRCFGTDPYEVFVVLSNPPSYGNGKADVSHYFMEKLSPDYFNKKQKGELRLNLVVSPDGKACLQTISASEGLTIPENFLLQVVDEMPKWEAGKHMGKAVYANVLLRLRLTGKKILVLSDMPGKVGKVSKKERKPRVKEEADRAPRQFKDPFESFDYYVKNGDEFVLDSLDQTPVYIDGAMKFLTRLYGSMRYPPEARDKSIQGTVILEVELNEFGSVTQTKIVQGIGGGCEDSALNALNGLQPLLFEPAIKDGNAVAVRFQIPVKFSLE